MYPFLRIFSLLYRSAYTYILRQDRFDLIVFAGKLDLPALNFRRECRSAGTKRIILHRVLRLLPSNNIERQNIGSPAETERRAMGEKGTESEGDVTREGGKCSCSVSASADALQGAVVGAFCASSSVRLETRKRERERGDVISDVAVDDIAFIPLAPTTLFSSPSLDFRPQSFLPYSLLPSVRVQSRATTKIRLAIIVDDKVEQCSTLTSRRP